MNKIDLIIDALEKAINACRLYDRQDIQDGGTVYLAEELEASINALAAARELKALAQPEPVTHAVIAGVLFDFMGWLTSRQKRLVLSASDEASPAVKVIEEFAKMRGLSLDDAKVKDWQEALVAARELRAMKPEEISPINAASLYALDEVKHG